MSRKKIKTPPPSNFASFSPSELFRFFFQIGHWTEGSFSDAFQTYTRGKLVSTVTINKWKNRDVIPTRYARPFFKMIEALSEPQMAKDWVLAFETVWALHSAGRHQIKVPAGGADFSDTICALHKKWIQDLYSKPRSEDIFSAADLYVPLQLYEITAGELDIYSTEDLIETRPNTWTFISGGPGSGKSMCALHFAASLCPRDVFPIFIRGRHLSNIDIDITNDAQSIVDSFSIRSFLKHFRASSFQTAYLILDGLDEIGRQSMDGGNTLGHILSDLEREQAACSAHNKTLNIIAVGRDAHITFSADQVPSGQSRSLSLLSLDGSLPRTEVSADQRQGQDFRSLWWETYLAATQNEADPTLPDFLSLEYDDFTEFGSDPLLSFLMCQAALEPAANGSTSKLPHERVNALTFTSNRNEIYQRIIERLALKVGTSISPYRFRSVLQHIAIAAWQSEDGQTADLNELYGSLENLELRQGFKALGLDPAAAMPPDILLTSFYFRLAPSRAKQEDMAIEFAHKTFSEYLISSLLFDRFRDLISAVETQKNVEEALKAWAFVSHAGHHEPSLADFCQQEAALRFEDLSAWNCDAALEIIKHHLSAHQFKGSGFETLKQWQQSSSLLFFIWSCLNLERQKRTRKHFDLKQSSSHFGLNDLKSFQSPSAITYQSGSLIAPSLDTQNFLTFSLSGLNIAFADMNQLSFSLGHMENAEYEDTSFAMTHWSQVKISGTLFTRSIFQQAMFHQWRVLKSDFANCLFQGCRFQGALISDCQMTDVFFSQCHFSEVEFSSPDFENVIFDRCVFSQCDFTRLVKANSGLGAKFRYCTFLNMDSVTQHIPSADMIGTISQNPDNIRRFSTQNTKDRNPKI